ncbi:hypothetical protein EV195_11212 [Tenacibaculum skagerrakense]|uniref:HEPN AbiJ-N-terminal domain-containing protein n=1 Tax=Tenacibaculum skagerrakense TaxID=186571 RepID=A0A4R2NL69_9FLAO|nr:hypothetical protein [Tenacibaculum skagerrakense]TCP22363.1 hypothetical protein EV195_11212 [Tenacibaculum skagerrakense]
MRFSQRIGKRPIKVELEKEKLSTELRNSLWTLIIELVIESKNEDTDRFKREKWTPRSNFFRSIWIHFFKRPIDNLPISHDIYYGQVEYLQAQYEIRKWFYGVEWDLALDFVEFCVNYDANMYSDQFNSILKREMSAYRFVDGSLVEINSKEEVVEIETAIKNSGKFNSVKTHLKRAIELYADKKNPDYRNSIKESISAVESLSKIIVQNNKTTLGQALKIIEKKHNIPKSLKSAFSSLYGYTSDEGGIRHSLLEKNVKIDMEEARFMLITCSAFVNYLISKK